MKLLLDNNLSPRLVTKLADLYPDSNHVAGLGLDKASDLQVWEVAQNNKYCLVTKDSDFNDLASTKGFPPKVIWLRLGNGTTAQIELLLRNHIEIITAFMQDPEVGILELQ